MSIILKPLSDYYNETVECGGKKGDSVLLAKESCGAYLHIYEIKAYRYTRVVKPGTCSKVCAQKYGQALLADYNASIFNCLKFAILMLIP